MDRTTSNTGLSLVTAAFLFIAAGLSGQAYSDTGEAPLLLQMSPAQGGKTNLGVGVHHFAMNSEITLVATPKPGYRFVRWLGDVSDPIANNTAASIDEAKIIIAVFAPLDQDLLTGSGGGQNASHSGLHSAEGDYARGGMSGGTGSRSTSSQGNTSYGFTPWTPPNQPFPVPEQEPEPIPEPATIALLGLGSMFLLRRRRA